MKIILEINYSEAVVFIPTYYICCRHRKLNQLFILPATSAPTQTVHIQGQNLYEKWMNNYSQVCNNYTSLSSYHICHQSLIPHFVCRVFSMCDILNNLNNFLRTKDSSLLICWMLFVYFLMPIFWQQIETCPLRSTKLKMPTKIPVVQKFQFGSSETQR